MSEEKTEQPTDKKIEDAREKGQVAMSKDLARLCTLVVGAEIAFIGIPLWRESIQSLMELSILRIGAEFQAAMWEMLISAGMLLVIVFAIYFIACTIAGVFGHWGQFGVLISTKALEPNLDKLNPVNGLKQLFAKKKLVEVLLTTLKAMVIAWLVFVLAREQLPAIVSLSGGEPKDAFTAFVAILRSIFHIVIVLCLCIALVDYGVQHHFHIKSLMMDMEEIKREFKESEGDPMVKGKRKQLARELAMSGPSAKTAKSNAVVVNPTHFAVAMLYDPVDAPVPVVLAKGKDEIAQAMIERARECGIPVIRHVWLARTLYATCHEDAVIPKSSYEAAAYVYAAVAELVAANDTGREVELESYGEPPATRH
ncbi:EscU/YscU/HrcU family type III secretion system export apparatus switch protein [Herbaspirillum sp. HC18]|nr:EscU/YscU/HrcU family type III secretion system export apparatus switch protein [Herbaspirillum sp. HC18]